MGFMDEVMDKLAKKMTMGMVGLMIATAPQDMMVDSPNRMECPITEWEEWGLCQGECKDSMVVGHQMRYRYFLIDGVKYSGYENPEEVDYDVSLVTEYCLRMYHTHEKRKCQDSCDLMPLTNDQFPSLSQSLQDWSKNYWAKWK